MTKLNEMCTVCGVRPRPQSVFKNPRWVSEICARCLRLFESHLHRRKRMLRESSAKGTANG